MSLASRHEVLSGILPGQIGLEKGVLPQSVCEMYGATLLKIILSSMTTDEIEAMEFSPIHDVCYASPDSLEKPFLIASLTSYLDGFMPSDAGDVSLVRLRYQRRCDYTFPHTDSQSDYRLTIPLLGAGELAIYDPLTREVLGTQLFEPGDIMVLNNNTQDGAKVPHSVVSVTDERLVLVYGREIVNN